MHVRANFRLNNAIEFGVNGKTHFGMKPSKIFYIPFSLASIVV